MQLSLEGARTELEDRILSASVVPPRKGERAKLQPLLDAFFTGLEAKAGDRAGDVLSAYLDRSAQGLIDLITDESRAIAPRVRVEQVVEPEVFAPERVGRPETSDNLDGAFTRGVGYVGWTRSLYEQAWFDSAPERAASPKLNGITWRYLLAREQDIASAKGSWKALQGLGRS